MAAKVRRLSIGVTLTVAVSLAIVLLAPSPVVPASAYVVGSGELPSVNVSSFEPQSMVDDAAILASQLFGKDEAKCHDFISQLLATYLIAKDKDVVIIINSGGWGWTPFEEFAYGQDIVAGVEAELVDSLGYSTLWLDYYRTAHSLNGCLSELMLASGLYPSKAKELALRIEFLTKHIPGIKVILAGISNGCTVCESAMRILEDNSQVYSVQLGPPFWNNCLALDRSLVLRSNGEVPDPFSQGNMFTIIRANLEAMFGISQENPGHILLYIGAPGHEYRWQHPEVRSQITDFLDKNFGPK